MLVSPGKLINDSPASFKAFSGQPSAITAWKNLWNAANTSTQLIYMFGDSQETEPDGTEAGYVAKLNYEFYLKFGKCGMIMTHYIGGYGGGSPYGMWLSRGATPGVGTNSSPTSERLPGCPSFGRLTNANGYAAALTYDGSRIDPAVNVPVGNYFDPGSTLMIDVFARSRLNSKEMTYIFGAHNTNSPSFSPNSGTISTGTTTIGLNNADNAFRSQSLGPFTNPSPGTNPFNQIVLRPTATAGDGNDPDLHLVRFRKQTDTGGIYLHPFGVGGYTVQSFMTNHGSSGPMAQAFPQPNAIILGYATNDLYGSGRTAATVASDYATLIAALRGASFFNNANLLVIIKIDPPRTWAGDPSYITQHNLLNSALTDLTLTDANLIILNSKAVVERYGWQDNNATAFLADGVHYNGTGASLLAQVEVRQFSLMAGRL